MQSLSQLSAFLQCSTEVASGAPPATGPDCVPVRLVTKQAVDQPWPQGQSLLTPAQSLTILNTVTVSKYSFIILGLPDLC